MDFHEYSLGNVNGLRLGLVSTISLTGFLGVILLPFYVYYFGIGIFWEFFGIIFFVLIMWNHLSFRLMRYSKKSESIVSIPGYFSRRFGEKSIFIRMFSAVEIIILSVLITGYIVKEAAIILNAMTGVDKSVFTLVFLLIISCYCGIMGYNSMAKTVYIKAIFVLVVFLVLGIYMFTRQSMAELMRNTMRTDITGSVSEYLNVLYHNGRMLASNDYVTLLSKGLLVTGMPFMLINFFASRESRVITKGRNTAFVFLVIFFITSMFVGAIMRGFLYPERITNSISSFLKMYYDKLAEGGGLGRVMSILLIMLIMVALISIVEAFINSITVIFFEDIINRGNVVRVDHKFMRETLISISMIFGVLIFFVEQYLGHISISGLMMFVAVLGCSISPTVFMSLVWERMNGAGCIAGLIFGMAGVGIFEYAPIIKVDGVRQSISVVFGLSPILPAFILSCLGIILFSLLTKKPSKEIVEEFREVRNRIVE